MTDDWRTILTAVSVTAGVLGLFFSRRDRRSDKTETAITTLGASLGAKIDGVQKSTQDISLSVARLEERHEDTRERVERLESRRQNGTDPQLKTAGQQ